MEKTIEEQEHAQKLGKNFMYDEDFDRLLVSKKQDSDIMNGSVMIMDLILDLNTENKVVNIELKHASEYLEAIGIYPEILHTLTNASFIFKKVLDGYLIYFILESDDKTERIPYNVYFGKSFDIIG